MTLSLLEFSQKCLNEIEYEYLTLFDLIKGETASFSTYPEEWCAHYLAEKYYEYDYVHLKSLYLPVLWGENISKNVTPLQNKIFKEAQDFQIYKGITIPFLSSNLREFITIVFSKNERMSNSKFIDVKAKLHMCCQMIFTYKQILEMDTDSQEHVLKFIEEVMAWQKESIKQTDKRKHLVAEILSDIRASQMFIAHHETKELGLETLSRVYKDIENLT